MQDEREENCARRALEKRTVDIVNVLLEDMIEVADGLMQVEAEDEAYWGHALADHE